MARSLSYRSSKSARAPLSTVTLLLIGCLTVIVLSVLLLALHRVNAQESHISYTLEAGESLPTAAELCGAADAVYSGEMPALTQTGEYLLEAVSSKGRQTVAVTVVDTTPPTMDGLDDITVYVGESVAYRKNIVLKDNGGDEGLTLSVDSSAVNLSEEGAYTVVYTAADVAGNTASATVSVYVKARHVNEALLFEGVQRVCAEILTDGMNKEEQLRAVYDYVQGNISYANHSDKTDWIGEAYNGLFVTGSGDCFTYFAAAKAFLTYLDIQFIELQRAPGLTEETHYWMLVNISDTPGVRTWYHYDATRLRAQYNHSGCLLTDKQAQAYNKVRPHFYTHNTEDLPATSQIIITDTPELEAYY